MPAPALAAIPILVSFAEAAGIVVSGIATAAGIDKLSNKVEEYIEDNPEQAQKIFAMIMPEQGLANILKNKSDDGEESSETEEVVESEPGSTKDVVLGAVNSPTGSYQDKNATGNYGSKRGRVIRALEDAGKIRKGNDPNYDASKKYQGYKRFIRPKKADGGIMQAKRKNFRGGGMDAGAGSNFGSENFGGGGGNARENYRTKQYTTPKTKTTRSGGDGNIITKSAKDLAALINVPVQGIQSLFGNPFNRVGGFKTKIGLTKGQIDNLEEDANLIGGLKGNITNTTYGSPNNTFGFHKNMDLTDFANSATFGQGNFTTDSTTGKKSFDGGAYDFDGKFGAVGNFVDAGGLTGVANKFGENLYENPGKITEMNYLANGGGVGSMMQPKSKTGKAVNELQAKAPEGEFLAYINPDEASMLKRAGGSGEPVNGIPSFRPQDMGNAANQAASAAMGGGSGGPNNDGTGDYSNATQTANHVAAQKAARQRVAADNRKKQIKALEQTYGTGKNAGIFGGFNPLSMIAGLIGGPFAGLAMRGITSLGKNFKGLNKKMRGTNPDGTTRTQAEYEQARFDRQQTNRLDKLYSAKDKGYNSLFGMKTTDFTPGQQSKIDMLEQNYDPTTARNVDSGRGSGLRNTLAAQSMPKANITGLSNNDFDGVQNVDRSITSGQINEFGDNRNINMDEFATQDAIDNRLMQEYLTNQSSFQQPITSDQIDEFQQSPQFSTSLIDEFGDNRNINMDEFADNNMQMQNYMNDQSNFQQPITASQIDEFGDNRNINMDEFAGNNIQMQNYLNDQVNYNADPLGNPNMDPRVVPEEYGLVGNQEFSLGELINNARPAEFPNTNTIKTPPRLFGG